MIIVCSWGIIPVGFRKNLAGQKADIDMLPTILKAWFVELLGFLPSLQQAGSSDEELKRMYKPI